VPSQPASSSAAIPRSAWRKRGAKPGRGAVLSTGALCSEKISGGFVVRDANGQALAYVYCRATETDAMQAKVLTEDEARRVAANIARLPELLGRKE
jgi:hypothetical protein